MYKIHGLVREKKTHAQNTNACKTVARCNALLVSSPGHHGGQGNHGLHFVEEDVNLDAGND